MDKKLHIYTSEIQRDGKDTYYFHKYEPTSYEVLAFFFDRFHLDKKEIKTIESTYMLSIARKKNIMVVSIWDYRYFPQSLQLN